MSIQLQVVEPPASGVSWYEPKAGDCWPCSWDIHQIPGRAPCWVVRLPGGGYVWHTNGRSTKDGEGLWNVSGEPPNLTVTPSINIGPGIWHGWITNGQLSPDVDHQGIP